MSDCALRALADRSTFLDHFGDPSTWEGDWRRRGRYLVGVQQVRTHQALEENHRLIIALAIKQQPSRMIAAVMGVSRESIDRRLRPAGFKNRPGVMGGRTKQKINSESR